MRKVIADALTPSSHYWLSPRLGFFVWFLFGKTRTSRGNGKPQSTIIHKKFESKSGKTPLCRKTAQHAHGKNSFRIQSINSKQIPFFWLFSNIEEKNYTNWEPCGTEGATGDSHGTSCEEKCFRFGSNENWSLFRPRGTWSARAVDPSAFVIENKKTKPAESLTLFDSSAWVTQRWLRFSFFRHLCIIWDLSKCFVEQTVTKLLAANSFDSYEFHIQAKQNNPIEKKYTTKRPVLDRTRRTR